MVFTAPAYAAAGDITTVIDSIRNWVAGILAALATLFLTIGGVRYLIANGNPRAMEEGKAAIKSALIVQLDRLGRVPIADLLSARYERYRHIGVVVEPLPGAVPAKRNEPFWRRMMRST